MIAQFISTLFLEAPQVRCCRLPYPFTQYAVTEYGTIFLFPIKLVFDPAWKIPRLDETSTLFPIIMGDTQYVVLKEERTSVRHILPVKQIVFCVFHGLPFDVGIVIGHKDNNIYNNHVNNLYALEEQDDYVNRT